MLTFLLPVIILDEGTKCFGRLYKSCYSYWSSGSLYWTKDTYPFQQCVITNQHFGFLTLNSLWIGPHFLLLQSHFFLRLLNSTQICSCGGFSYYLSCPSNLMWFCFLVIILMGAPFCLMKSKASKLCGVFFSSKIDVFAGNCGLKIKFYFMWCFKSIHVVFLLSIKQKTPLNYSLKFSTL